MIGVLALLLTALTPSAHACSTYCLGTARFSASPPTTDAPTNLVFGTVDNWERSETSLSLESETGERIVLLTEERVYVNETTLLYTPEYDLEPNTLYTVVYTATPYDTGEERTVYFNQLFEALQFTTGDGRDEDAPQNVSIVDWTPKGGPARDTCSAWWEIKMTLASDIGDDGYYEGQASPTPAFDSPFHMLSTDTTPRFATCTSPVPGMEAGTQYWWRVRAIDTAANTSAWSEPVQFRTGRSCDGCASTGSPQFGLIGLGLLALMGRVRRER